MTIYNIFTKIKLFAKTLSQFFVIHMISCFSCSIGLIKYPDYPNKSDESIHNERSVELL